MVIIKLKFTCWVYLIKSRKTTSSRPRRTAACSGWEECSSSRRYRDWAESGAKFSRFKSSCEMTQFVYFSLTKVELWLTQWLLIRLAQNFLSASAPVSSDLTKSSTQFETLTNGMSFCSQLLINSPSRYWPAALRRLTRKSSLLFGTFSSSL